MKTLSPVFLSHVQRLIRNANLPIGVCIRTEGIANREIGVPG